MLYRQTDNNLSFRYILMKARKFGFFFFELETGGIGGNANCRGLTVNVFLRVGAIVSRD